MILGETPLIGIDLGSYNSSVALLMGDESIMLKSREGLTDQGTCFPSFVEFDEKGDVLKVGEVARRAVEVSPQRVIWGAKRLIGKSYRQVKQSGDDKRFQYEVAEGEDGSCQIRVSGRQYSPTQIASFVLRKIKEDAEAGFNPIGRSITEAVITVPAYFGPLQKAETERAAKMAGFTNPLLIPESTSAALAYRLTLEKVNQYIVVIDLGAGTLDVTVALLYTDEKGVLQTEEKGHGGDTALGGIDIDDAIFDAICRRHRLRVVTKDPQGRARLRAELERVKIRLSTDSVAHVNFGYPKGTVDIRVERTEVEAAARDVVERCRGPIRVALQEANVEPHDISHVLLVGGPVQMPMFRKMVADEFAASAAVVQEIEEISSRGFPVNPMEAVARGAVLGSFGAVTPHGYGILMGGQYSELIPRRSRYPCENMQTYSHPGRDRSLRLSLIQKAADPRRNKEVFTELGVFQFDYRPEPGQTQIEVEAEYTENGVLNIQIVQPSTLVRLPLYKINRFEGKTIDAPPTPLPAPPPQYPAPPPQYPAPPPQYPAPPLQHPAPTYLASWARNLIGSSHDPADATQGAIESTSGGRVKRWSQESLENAIRIANQLIQIARVRMGDVPVDDLVQVESSVAELTQAIEDRWEDTDTRRPRVGNLTRALGNVLMAASVITHWELTEVLKGLDSDG